MPTVEQRINLADRIDAARWLQNIGEQRRAHVLHQGLKGEHDRLSGDFHRIGPASCLKAKIHTLKKLVEEAESRMGVANCWTHYRSSRAIRIHGGHAQRGSVRNAH